VLGGNESRQVFTIASFSSAIVASIGACTATAFAHPILINNVIVASRGNRAWWRTHTWYVLDSSNNSAPLTSRPSQMTRRRASVSSWLCHTASCMRLVSKKRRKDSHVRQSNTSTSIALTSVCIRISLQPSACSLDTPLEIYRLDPDDSRLGSPDPLASSIFRLLHTFRCLLVRYF